MKRRFVDRGRDEEAFDVEAWQPKTQLGREVKSRGVTTLEEIFRAGRAIQEPAIIDVLLPSAKSEIIEIASVQRMTKNNRKQKFRATAVIGDGNGHVGVGSGKDVEVKAAISSATVDAKRHIIPILLGCGSWQCQCGTKHSLPFTIRGRCGGVEVVIRPAPRGLGIVASAPIKKLLTLAGVKDAWSFSKGRTKARYNAMLAVYNALEGMNSMKNISPAAQQASPAEAKERERAASAQAGKENAPEAEGAPAEPEKHAAKAPRRRKAQPEAKEEKAKDEEEAKESVQEDAAEAPKEDAKEDIKEDTKEEE